MESIQYGIRATWPDGHTEVEKRKSRYEAEVSVRLRSGAAESRGTGEEFVVVHRVISDWSTGVSS